MIARKFFVTLFGIDIYLVYILIKSNFFGSINGPATWGLCSYYAKEHFLSETLYGQ